MKVLKYILVCVVLGFVSCRGGAPASEESDFVAKVGDKTLTISQISAITPKNYHGEDSVAFVQLNVDKWVRNQVKLREAERQFATSQTDVEARVEEYRQSLLMKRLDEQYLSSTIDTVFTADELAQYYQTHIENFRLNSNILKGDYLRTPKSVTNGATLSKLMESDSDSKHKDLLSLCEKNNYTYVSLSEEWVDANELLDNLPLTRGAELSKVLSKRGVTHLSDENYNYYYKIVDHRAVGDVAPQEWVESTIRQILITERGQALIKERDQSLYDVAVSEGVVQLAEVEQEEN